MGQDAVGSHRERPLRGEELEGFLEEAAHPPTQQGDSGNGHWLSSCSVPAMFKFHYVYCHVIH